MHQGYEKQRHLSSAQVKKAVQVCCSRNRSQTDKECARLELLWNIVCNETSVKRTWWGCGKKYTLGSNMG